MERNDFASGGAAEGQDVGAQGSHGGGTNEEASVTDRARDMAGSARDKLADMGSAVRERTGNAKNSLADALESGADRLRQRTAGGNGRFAAEAGSGTIAVEGDGRLAGVGDKVATGMQATASWLREADLDGLRTSVETQVKEHPGRTLLIAVGVGYLLGKALRK